MTDRGTSGPGTETWAIAPLWQRIHDTFAAPRRLVGHLRGATPWLDVLLISTALAVLSVLAIPDAEFIEPMREAVSRRGEPVEITSAPEVVARWGRAVAMLATLATHPISAFVIAGVLTLAFSLIGRGLGRYRDYLALTAHAMLIPGLGNLLTLVIRLATGQYVVGNPMSGLNGSADAPNLFLTSVAAIDPLFVWMLAVIGIGTHQLDARHSAVRSSILLIAGYVLLIVGSAALLHPGAR